MGEEISWAEGRDKEESYRYMYSSNRTWIMRKVQSTHVLRKSMEKREFWKRWNGI